MEPGLQEAGRRREARLLFEQHPRYEPTPASAHAVFQKLAEGGGLRLGGLAGHEPVEPLDVGANEFGLVMITSIPRLGQAEGVRVEPARFREPALLEDDGGKIVLEVGEERAFIVGVGLDDGDRLSIVPRGFGQRAAEVLEQGRLLSAWAVWMWFSPN